MLNVDKDIARHSRGQCQLLLGKPLALSYMANPGSDIGANTPPLRGTIGVVLAGSRRHATQLLRGRTKSLPY